MVTADQLVAHAVGDYILQSDRMATGKATSTVQVIRHVAAYLLPFLLFGPSWAAFSVIALSHFFIDRYRLARFVCWAKNGARGPITETGYPEDRPAWLAVWLLIITDNILHVVINGAALRWL